MIKQRNVLGKIQKISEKGFSGEILQGLYFDPPILTGSARYAKQKTFFWGMTPTADNFANAPTYQRVFWVQNSAQKVKKLQVAIEAGSIMKTSKQIQYGKNSTKNHEIGWNEHRKWAYQSKNEQKTMFRF